MRDYNNIYNNDKNKNKNNKNKNLFKHDKFTVETDVVVSLK